MVHRMAGASHRAAAQTRGLAGSRLYAKHRLQAGRPTRPRGPEMSPV